MTTAIRTTHRVLSSRFGPLEVEEERTIHLPNGLIGFEQCRRFTVVTPDPENPIKWLQSLDDGAVAFPIIEPWRFLPDYAPVLSRVDAEELGVTEETPRLVFVVVTIPRGAPRLMTANLLGPLIIDPESRVGRQVIVLNEEYTTRHRILADRAVAA